MKGLILAGGLGTRLHPLTLVTSKQLLPVYDKPMISYPLSTLLLAGIKDIALISTPHHLPAYRAFLGDGSRLGISLTYIEQPEPGGLAQAFLLGESFIGGQPSCLILGDNIFHSEGLATTMQAAAKLQTGAKIFAYQVKDPERYGIVEFDSQGKVMSLEEKPAQPKSNYALAGLYFVDGHASAMARRLKPSARGELEVTDLMKLYLQDQNLEATSLSRGTAWLDTGTTNSLMEAALFVQIIEQRTGLKIGCPEEAAWRMGYIDDRQLGHLAKELSKSEYGKYLQEILTEGKTTFS